MVPQPDGPRADRPRAFRRRPAPRIARAAIAFSAVIAGCSGASPDQGALAGLRASERDLGTDSPRSDARTPAIVVGDDPVEWPDARVRLGEAAGAAVVEELVLDRLVTREFHDRALTLAPVDAEREREFFVEQLRRSDAGDDGAAPAVLAEVRRSRGLGPARFRALLERNAMLRALVRDTIEVPPAAVDQELRVRYGPARRCRIIVVGTEREAAAIYSRLAGAGAELPARFEAEARAGSIDPSASRGGLLDPISPDDPSYAVAVRQSLRNLAAGQLSGVVVLEHGYALVLGEGEIAARTPPADARAKAETALRRRQERLAMDRLAQRLLSTAPVTVFDPGMAWSWQQRLAPRGP